MFQTVSKAVAARASAKLSIDCRTWHLVLRVTITLPYPPLVVRSYACTNIHYVDDFITMGADLAECTHNITVMHETCARLGLPPEPEKDEGTATCITFLGIEIDTVAMELRLPKDKLAWLTSDLEGWRGRKACKKRDLLSLIGVLSHACKVVRAGRTFLRRLIELSVTAKKLEHFVRLSREARSDIEWWW